MADITIHTAAALKVDELRAELKKRGAAFSAKDRKADLIVKLIALLQNEESLENSSTAPVEVSESAEDVIDGDELMQTSETITTIISDRPTVAGETGDVRDEVHVVMPSDGDAVGVVQEGSAELIPIMVSSEDKSNNQAVDHELSAAHKAETEPSDGNKNTTELYHVGVCKFDRIEIKEFKSLLEARIGISISSNHYHADKRTGCVVVDLQSEELMERLIATVLSGIGEKFKNSGMLRAARTNISVADIIENPMLSQNILSNQDISKLAKPQQSKMKSQKQDLSPQESPSNAVKVSRIVTVLAATETTQADAFNDLRNRGSILSRVGGLFLRSLRGETDSNPTPNSVAKRSIFNEATKTPRDRVVESTGANDAGVEDKSRASKRPRIGNAGEVREAVADGSIAILTATAKEAEEMEKGDEEFSLDDLFRRTKSSPALYWLPVEDAEVNRRRALGDRYMGASTLRDGGGGAVCSAEITGGRFDPDSGTGEAGRQRSGDHTDQGGSYYRGRSEYGRGLGDYRR